MLKLVFYFFVCFSLIQNTKAEENKMLSLNEAIYLAVARNPNVQSTELSHILQKLNVSIQEWEFYPHYSLQAGLSVTSLGHNYNVQPGASLLTPIGTSITFASTNLENGHFRPG